MAGTGDRPRFAIGRWGLSLTRGWALDNAICAGWWRYGRNRGQTPVCIGRWGCPRQEDGLWITRQARVGGGTGDGPRFAIGRWGLPLTRGWALDNATSAGWWRYGRDGGQTPVCHWAVGLSLTRGRPLDNAICAGWLRYGRNRGQTPVCIGRWGVVLDTGLGFGQRDKRGLVAVRPESGPDPGLPLDGGGCPWQGDGLWITQYVRVGGDMAGTGTDPGLPLGGGAALDTGMGFG
jgi:hypothetical protein